MKRKRDLFRLCNGMDELDIRKKERCLSFSKAMLSIEGMKVSDEVALALEDWKAGKKHIYQYLNQHLKNMVLLHKIIMVLYS